MSVDPAGAIVLPQSVRWSVRSWLIAVAAGVLETAIQATTSEGYNAAVRVVHVVAVIVALMLMYRPAANSYFRSDPLKARDNLR